MRPLNYHLKQLCERNRDGSFSTQANRRRLLDLIADQLHGLGYKGMGVQSLKPKHIDALVQQWQAQGIATGTLKNRMAALRWWAEKIGKQNVIARSNEHYGIPHRRYVTNHSKACAVAATALERVREPHVRTSLELQQVFGLRREEAIKFQPRYADQGDHLRLKASWCKGGKARDIPIRTEAQRAVLDRACQLAGQGSLIPPQRTYVQQLRLYERHTANAGLSKLHGLRHGYAQQRYQELTNWPAPAAGGPTSKQLSPEQKALDREVRLLISQELGHERESITAVYLGR
jgi:site-specific recombinase XerC